MAVATRSMPRVRLQTIYGPSHFGSGRSTGAVHCSANCRTVGRVNNGFCTGPESVEVIDPLRPARFYARGSDSVGDDSRFWCEQYEYRPGQGWVSVDSDIFDRRADSGPRLAWVAAG